MPPALDRQRRAEHVADELRVDRPVHAELELLDEAGRDTDREVDQKQRAEEVRQPQPRLVARPPPQRLEDRDDRAQAQRQRHEQEVIERRRRKLGPRQIDRRGRDENHERRVEHRPRGRIIQTARNLRLGWNGNRSPPMNARSRRVSRSPRPLPPTALEAAGRSWLRLRHLIDKLAATSHPRQARYLKSTLPASRSWQARGLLAAGGAVPAAPRQGLMWPAWPARL